MGEVNKVRKLSRFLCQELMYDYASEELDNDRRSAMDNYLKENPDSKKELEDTMRAMKYVGQLSQTKLSEPLIDEINNHKGFFERSTEKLHWQQWPEFLKWGSEAFVISFVVALLAILLPWDSINEIFTSSSQVVTLSEMDRVTLEEEDELNEEMEDSEIGATAASTEGQGPQTVAQQETTASAAAKVAAQPKASPGVAKGVLHRAYMDLKDLENVSPDIVNLITSQGGYKAGKVRLGWRKPKGRYFHFAFPLKNYESLLTKLRDYGPVRIYKNPHQRVMPEGQIRIILWIEDKGPTAVPPSPVEASAPENIPAPVPETQTPVTPQKAEPETAPKAATTEETPVPVAPSIEEYPVEEVPAETEPTAETQ